MTRKIWFPWTEKFSDTNESTFSILQISIAEPCKKRNSNLCMPRNALYHLSFFKAER